MKKDLLVRWPTGRLRRIDRPGLDAARVAVLDEFAPERTASRRDRVIVIERNHGIQGELIVVEDDVVVTVGRFSADPGHVGPLAGVQLGRGFGETSIAILELLALRQVLE